jgi:leucyl/phenylalanyl-tRNA--protein transferase
MSFPDPRKATREGIVAVGGELNPDMLLAAYRSGIFPWPIDDLPLTWFCPPKRGILEFDQLKIPRSGEYWSSIS